MRRLTSVNASCVPRMFRYAPPVLVAIKLQVTGLTKNGGRKLG